MQCVLWDVSFCYRCTVEIMHLRITDSGLGLTVLIYDRKGNVCEQADKKNDFNIANK